MKYIFTASNSIASKLIRAVDKGRHSHCGLIIDPTYVLDAMGGRGTDTWFISSMKANALYYRVLELAPDSPELELENIAWLKTQIGREYDNWALPSLAIRNFFGTAPHWENPNKDFCAELLLRFACKNHKVIRDKISWAGRYGVRDVENCLVDAGAQDEA